MDVEEWHFRVLIFYRRLDAERNAFGCLMDATSE